MEKKRGGNDVQEAMKNDEQRKNKWKKIIENCIKLKNIDEQEDAGRDEKG